MAKKIEQPVEQSSTQIFSIAYDTSGRVLASSSTVPDSAAALKMFKAVLDAVARQTDALLLAAVEREAKSGGE